MATSAPGLSPEEKEALQASIFQRLHPRAYLERFLAEGFRPDGRALDGWRDVSVNVGASAFLGWLGMKSLTLLPCMKVQYRQLTAQHSSELGTRRSSVESKLKSQNPSLMRVLKDF